MVEGRTSIIWLQIDRETFTTWVGHRAAGHAARPAREALPVTGRARLLISSALREGESLFLTLV